MTYCRPYVVLHSLIDLPINLSCQRDKTIHFSAFVTCVSQSTSPLLKLYDQDVPNDKISTLTKVVMISISRRKISWSDLIHIVNLLVVFRRQTRIWLFSTRTCTFTIGNIKKSVLIITSLLQNIRYPTRVWQSVKMKLTTFPDTILTRKLHDEQLEVLNWLSGRDNDKVKRTTEEKLSLNYRSKHVVKDTIPTLFSKMSSFLWIPSLPKRYYVGKVIL